MLKVLKRRGKGKTTDLIKLSHQYNAPIITSASASLQHIKRSAQEMNICIPEPINIRSLSSESMRRIKTEKTQYLIDDLECVTSYLFEGKILGISMTTDDSELPRDIKVNKEEELKAAAQPLVSYLQKNYNPHTSILIEEDKITIKSDIQRLFPNSKNINFNF